MARNVCIKCQRPIKACICAFTDEINNKISVLVLQHPSEVKQVKGTVTLLKASLNACQILVGEDFSGNIELDNLLASHQALLLYPSKQAQDISVAMHNIPSEHSDISQSKPFLLIILDGTWKKAYRMFMLSKNLHALVQICLPDYLAKNGQYLIRKVAKKNALSSLEATCYALALLENELDDKKHLIDCGCYQPLLNKFAQFNQFQLSFRK
tara:strand:+ start:10610 stop:11242 length:633 start_codon:yes stop_codon:yes gene_type:complete